jgi:hypothetical protein
VTCTIFIQSARQEEIERVQRLQRRLSKLDLTIKRHVRDDDKMYGSVTAKNIAQKLEKSDMKIEEKDVLLEEAIKVLLPRFSPHMMPCCVPHICPHIFPPTDAPPRALF